MIGTTYCKLVGSGTLVEGPFLSTVDCGDCKKVEPDQSRFSQKVCLTIAGEGKTVHAGLLVSTDQQRSMLDNIQAQVEAVLLDVGSIERITKILSAELLFVDKHSTVEAEEAAKIAAVETAEREAEHAKALAKETAERLKLAAEDAQKAADEAKKAAAKGK